MIGICEYCGKIRQGRWKKRFCSKSCSAKFSNSIRPKLPRSVCLFCGKTTAKHNAKFCSQKCSHAATRKPLTPERLAKKRLKVLLAVRRYQARRYSQTPCDVDLDKVSEIYANCPIGFEVDHIIPISRGGLHHQDNLQYLSVSENRRKSNKLL